MGNSEGAYLGIDISARSTVLSIYKSNMDEPATVSTILGEENYSIPTVLAKRYGMGQWFFGDEAISKSRTKEAMLVDDLYTLALKNEEVFVDGESFQARELMVIYFNKLFAIPGPMAAMGDIEKLVVCVDQVNLEVMELMNYIISRLSIDSNRLMLIDRNECFYFYALSQRPELFLYSVALFDYSGSNMISCVLNRNQSTRPQMITLDVVNHGDITDNRDEKFDEIIADTFGSTLFSSVYLVGDGFDGEWMKVSLARLCKGRKVFMGKNLYSKGACYAGYTKDGKRDWPFIYIGDNDLKLNLSIKILENNVMKFFTLIDAGQSWYDAKGECEVILDGEPELEFYIQRPESREAHTEVLELTDMPKRENRTTRLRIEASPISDVAVSIVITDLGFGEISPSSGKSWEHTISIK
ncbi:hypothetical protein SAMN02910377_00535 [Pseudobutyrivibrio ruminis]|uniref:DUF5716 domain-containing protein n=1 Tax=Pseudobutyrivibrio ruminis TaxID=46206 RepID=A0A1H7FY53_9FIRM|nr:MULTISPECIES: DUF5716 family protein [Pseudobutyrivibrio]MBE5912542.1 hypothetical protein [Pseudobutyrivibrio ruminis]SEK30838.1 hypothetical protein SAMN02910377_00535 [Pseudobutyrivibrio ruminis]SFN96686.1 hypothetical protein SAMN05216351_102126 [Pseudobutyrivibrio sp. JW11]